MRVGIVSDTHDNTEAVAHVLAAFRARKVAFVLHAGDVTEPATLELFREWPGAVAFGNNDSEADVARAARAMGWEADESWSGEVGGKRFAMTHGDYRSRLAAAIDSRPDYVIHGHSHRAWDERVGATRVINPGACYRAPQYSVAVLDVATDALDVVAIPKSADGFD